MHVFFFILSFIISLYFSTTGHRPLQLHVTELDLYIIKVVYYLIFHFKKNAPTPQEKILMWNKDLKKKSILLYCLTSTHTTLF